jgi:hypothetical protein
MNKRTLQTLPRELFNLLKLNKFGGKEMLVNTGLSNVLTPAVIQPIKINGFDMAIGLGISLRDNTYVFYLFDNPEPNEKKFVILYKIQGGEVILEDDVPRFKNVPKSYRLKGNLLRLENQGEGTPPVLKNYHLVISFIEAEIGKMIAYGNYLLDENVKEEKIEKLLPFMEENFEIVHNAYTSENLGKVISY